MWVVWTVRVCGLAMAMFGLALSIVAPGFGLKAAYGGLTAVGVIVILETLS